MSIQCANVARYMAFGASAAVDLCMAKAAASDHYFAKVARSPSSPFVVRRKLAAIQAVAGCQIHSIGIGRKIVSGRPSNMLCVRFYVTQKLPRSLLSAVARIDEAIDGVPTDVIEAAPAYPAMSLACSRGRRTRARPLRPGASVGNEAVAGGTLAIRCTSRLPQDAGRSLLLSNSHVLADYGAALIGSAIIQPSAADGGTPLDRVATLLRFAPVVEGALAENRVDAAVAVLDPGIAVHADVCTVGPVHGISVPVEALVVHKHARTTGYSIGVIDDVACDVLLPLSHAQPERQARFVDQIRIRARAGSALFAQLGDSGALVVSKLDNRAVGLLFACPDNGTYAFANPIQAVLDLLKVDLG